MPASRNEPQWLPFDEIVAINRDVVALTNEAHLLVSASLLDGAINRPRNHYEYDGVTDVLRLAVILLFAICRNHPFQQGNKRTGFVAAVDFLFINGYELTIPDGDGLADWIVDVICGRMGEDDFVALLEPHVVECEL
ncbi:MAG: type II toxin-antitoxin system death-on-curing family toxin [Aestuariivirgaceae bacterium]